MKSNCWTQGGFRLEATNILFPTLRESEHINGTSGLFQIRCFSPLLISTMSSSHGLLKERGRKTTSCVACSGLKGGISTVYAPTSSSSSLILSPPPSSSSLVSFSFSFQFFQFTGFLLFVRCPRAVWRMRYEINLYPGFCCVSLPA